MALNAQGVQFFWGDTAGTTAATSTNGSTNSSCLVGQVASISGPSGSANQIDVTNLGSSGKEYLLGLKDEGEITLECFTDTTNSIQNLMWHDRAVRNKRKFVIDFNDTTAAATDMKLSGDGFISGYSFSFGVDNAIKTSITLRITGALGYSSSI